MNTLRRLFTVALAALGLSGRPNAQAQAARDDAGRQLRLMILNTKARDLGLSPTAEFPRVFGTIMDWPLGDQVATVVAISDGTASLYTTSTFGIIGGQAHEAVRAAGKRLLSAAERYHDEAEQTLDHSYPPKNQIKFYLLCYEGNRVIKADLDQTQAGTSTHVALFNAAQEVLTELRKSALK